MTARLAIEGGPRTIPQPLPSCGGGAGVGQMDDREISAVVDVLQSGELFRHHQGSRVRAFEAQAAEVIGVKHALMVNSGTSALICALTGLGIGPGDEVIVPAYTYIATAAAVVAVGAVPVIAEIDESLGLAPDDLEARITPHTRAVIPVYMQGVPARIDDMLSVARKHNLKVIEDCCQCIGGRYHGRMVGSFGDAGAWSLNYFKVITCGEGGLAFMNDDTTFERACLASDPALPMWLKGTGEQETWAVEPFSGQCYRVSEIQGALAYVQLTRLETILQHTRELKRAFIAALNPTPVCFTPQHIDDPDGDCGISAAILVHNKELAGRFAEALTAEGLPCGAAHASGFPDRHIACYWDSIIGKGAPHPGLSPWSNPAYRGSVEYSRDGYPRTMGILDRALRFGFHPSLTCEHAQQMADAINKVDAALA